ncbi:MAG: NAD(P)H-binding protein [Microbacteriaceae bacterium]
MEDMGDDGSHGGGAQLTVAVVGGTGTLGRQIVETLRARGHDARALARHVPDYPVDLTTGEGLVAALNGCDAVIDASNGFGSKAGVATLVEGSRRLLTAEHAAGVGHHVAISIVGCDSAPMSYYQIKVRQEAVVEAGPVPWTIVRATQFHTFVDGLMRQAVRVGVVPLLKTPLQPVDVGEVAAFVAEVAAGRARRDRVQIAGPEIADADEFARAWRAARHSRAIPLRIPLPGKLGRALRAGALTNPNPDASGTVRFVDWLAIQHG